MADPVGPDIEIEFTKNHKPQGPTDSPTPSSKSSPQFLAKPGAPRATRVMTRSRAKDLKVTGNTPKFTTWGGREAMTSDTMSGFAPMYKQFVNELSTFKNFDPALKNFDPAKIAEVVEILETPRVFDRGLIRELDSKCPGISNALYSVLRPQYSRGESGLISNGLSLDDADLLQRFNSLGFGTHLRAEMLTVINNFNFFKDIHVDIVDNGFNIIRTSDKTTLVAANVDEKKGEVTLIISDSLRPEDRDDAIKHMVMVAACHAQQNDSNTFMPTFGDNIYENIRVLQLAIGEFNLRIPQHAIASQQQEIEVQLTKISDPDEKQKAKETWDFWAQRAETFKDKVLSDGTKIVDTDHRPTDANGYFMNLETIQKSLRSKVTESVFPNHSGGARPSHP